MGNECALGRKTQRSVSASSKASARRCIVAWGSTKTLFDQGAKDTGTAIRPWSSDTSKINDLGTRKVIDIRRLQPLDPRPPRKFIGKTGTWWEDRILRLISFPWVQRTRVCRYRRQYSYIGPPGSMLTM